MIVIDDVGRGLVCGGRRDVGDGLLAKLDLLRVARWKEADLCRAANVALQEAAVGRSDNFNDVARVDGEVSVDFRLVLLDAHDRCAWMSDRASS